MNCPQHLRMALLKVQSGDMSLSEFGFYSIRCMIGNGQVARSEVATRTGLSESKVSAYDRRLRSRGLLISNRTGRQNEVQTPLSDGSVCPVCFGGGRLGAGAELF
jgi:hypothetical protein